MAENHASARFKDHSPDRIRESKVEDQDSTGSEQTSFAECPECTSSKVYKDGFRKFSDGSEIQRFRCPRCGHRFSKHKQRIITKRAQIHVTPETQILNRQPSLTDHCQGDKLSSGELINLTEVANPRENGLAGATTATEKVPGKIVDYSFWMLKQGYAKSTIECRTKLMKRLAKLGANVLDPESVKEIIAHTQTWSEGRKELAVETYSNFLLMADGKWDPPRYKRIEKLPFIPAEKEIDDLIAGSGEKTATFLQLLKETGARAGEAWSLKWTDIDFTSSTVRITPEKRSNPRMFKVSSKLLAMLAFLPKKPDYAFGGSDFGSFYRAWLRQRARLSKKLANPRLQQISFHTFRHWKATMEYHKTKDILHVMKILGHRNIKNTLRYTQLVTFEDDDYVCKTATNVKEATELIEIGFEYVCDMQQVKLFRKRK